ncbi:Rieske [2Fe-2S] iron-sulphur domain [Ostreococcus tauri]|uniref:Rieske [2Fe-2S] iron-sulphur domain n=1 Tax=Ostreococcus tauri TaxID=70448 RepID=A0A090M1C9_OSTTA|nr:Rieske [2Fe-2S] iron-sulphur domain [Ostreococcus tauri]CEF98045.1 Rieske [2Fe-2S] iron-sulphur domain [Ostreococcus tauri]|eukprot:XP_022839044.1 Rieske [2Fe-2S] iron-sulphur domain [Ostreococcus tauri]
MSSSLPSAQWRDVASVDALSAPNARLAVCVDGRHLALVRSGDSLRAIDATCYHMGGPLLRAEIEDLPGRGACLVCPWHRYHVSLTTGERVYRNVEGAWIGIAKKQRVHEIKEDLESGRVLVRLCADEDGTWESDRYARKAPPPSVRGVGTGGRGMPSSGQVFMASRPREINDLRDGGECGPMARTSGVRSMVAESMRGGDGVAPWAMERGRLDSANAFGATSVRNVRRESKINVTFDDGDTRRRSEGEDGKFG